MEVIIKLEIFDRCCGAKAVNLAGYSYQFADPVKWWRVLLTKFTVSVRFLADARYKMKSIVDTADYIKSGRQKNQETFKWLVVCVNENVSDFKYDHIYVPERNNRENLDYARTLYPCIGI